MQLPPDPFRGVVSTDTAKKPSSSYCQDPAPGIRGLGKSGPTATVKGDTHLRDTCPTKWCDSLERQAFRIGGVVGHALAGVAGLSTARSEMVSALPSQQV